MTNPCQHCEEEHAFHEPGWPANWNDDRRADFYLRMTRLGVIDTYIPSMASEIERLLLVSPYRVTEHELYRYLESSNTLHRRFLDLLDKQHRWAAHCKRSLGKLCPTEKHGCCVGILLIFVFVFTTLLVHVLTLPVRLSFTFRIWMVKRQIHPLFTGWLNKHGVRK